MSASNPGALIASVAEDSPAYQVGFEPGCRILAVDGHPLHDILDWRWLSSDDIITVDYVDNDGDEGTVEIERMPGEDWGFGFDGIIFDETRTCVNACSFCFMRQLPKGLRGALSLRDDDFRLSFLTGTFITLTNLDDDDIARISEQRLTPLRVSLHAVDPDVRRSLIGKRADRGIANLERLLDAGIEFDAQVVLVPGVNDGKVLDETLEWAYARPGIKTVGVVPLGFTRHQALFDRSFDDPSDAKRVIDQIAEWQGRAMEERGHPWAFAADELYRNAFGERVLDELPDVVFYGDFSMFEDGIGIIRSVADAFQDAKDAGVAERCALALKSSGMRVRHVCGEAMEPYVSQLFEQVGLERLVEPLVVRNEFFGGNVNVTGLLCACDVVDSIERDWGSASGSSVESASSAEGISTSGRTLAYFLPSVMFNTDGLTLDGWTLADIKGHLGPEIASRVFLAPAVPIDYMEEIAEVSNRFHQA